MKKTNIALLFKRVLSIILMLLFIINANGQIKESIYGSIGDDEFTSILKISDGGYIISGSATLSNGFGRKDIYVLRLNSNYDIIWSKIYGGSYDDEAYVSLINSNGNIILGCSSSSHNNGNNSDIIIMEIDLFGNVQWSKSLRTNSYDEIPRKIIKSLNGFTICSISNYVGTTSSPDMLVFEVDSTCSNILWQNLIGTTDYSGDIPSSIITSNLGGFVLVGGSRTSTTNYDQIIIRLSSNGVIQSHLAFGSIENENTQDVIELENNDLMLLGNFRSLSGDGLEIALVKIKSDYSVDWIKTYGDLGSKDDRPYAFKRALSGEYFLAGYSYTFSKDDKDLIILQIDQNGNLIKASNYGGEKDEQPFDMHLSDEVIVVGASNSNSFGLMDCYMFKNEINKFDDNTCYNVEVFENTLNLSGHVFDLYENNPDLIIGIESFVEKSVISNYKDIFYKKILKGNISNYLSDFDYGNVAKVNINLLDSLNGEFKITSLKEENLNMFSSSITSNTKIFINAEISSSVPFHTLMKYRNGFDTYQMENIVTNRTDAPLQIEPSAFAMVAADVDISDKVRSNDISLLQQRIVNKINGFPQQIPTELNQDFLDWRFIDEKTVNSDQSFRKGNRYPYYSPQGYCRDNVPDIPFLLMNQGSCDSTYIETYLGIFLGDLVDEGKGIAKENFNDHTSMITFDIDDIHDLGDNTYRVFTNHTLNEKDKFVSFDFTLDYDESAISIMNTQMTVEDKHAVPQYMFNDYNSEELLFTSYTASGYPLNGNLLYIDIRKPSGLPTIEDLGQLHVFANGMEVPASIRSRSQTSTGIDIANDISSFINLYPNPADDHLIVSLPLLYAKDVRVEFLNIIGQSVLVFNNEQVVSSIELDLSTLPAGIYECLISVKEKPTVMKKVVIK